MTESPPPPLAIALTALRTSRGWRQRQLARVLGVPENLISQYEQGHKPLSWERLLELIAPLGLRSEDVDATLLWLDLVGGEVNLPAGPPVELMEADRQRFRQAAASAGRAAVASTFAALGRALVQEEARGARHRARALWARLRGYEAKAQRVLVESAEEYWSWALCELVCEKSVEAAASKIARSRELAELAVLIAERSPGGDAWRAQLQGYAWAFVGNARRVGGDLDGAERGFARSRALWTVGAAADPGVLDPSRVLDLEASLLRARRRFAEALELLDLALALSPSPERTGRILLKKAFTCEQEGDCEGAIEALERAAPLIERKAGPRQVWVHRLNLAVNLCHLGRHTDAAPLAAEARELAIGLRNEIDLLRVVWIEARIAAGLGRRQEAIAALLQVRRDFAHRKMAYDIALATLELAVLLLEENRDAEVRALAGEAVALFESLRIHREALAAVRLFWQATERETAAVELGRRLVKFLERARHDPELRFESVSPDGPAR